MTSHRDEGHGTARDELRGQASGFMSLRGIIPLICEVYNKKSEAENAGERSRRAKGGEEGAATQRHSTGSETKGKRSASSCSIQLSGGLTSRRRSIAEQKSCQNVKRRLRLHSDSTAADEHLTSTWRAIY